MNIKSKLIELLGTKRDKLEESESNRTILGELDSKLFYANKDHEKAIKVYHEARNNFNHHHDSPKAQNALDEAIRARHKDYNAYIEATKLVDDIYKD